VFVLIPPRGWLTVRQGGNNPKLLEAPGFPPRTRRLTGEFRVHPFLGNCLNGLAANKEFAALLASDGPNHVVDLTQLNSPIPPTHSVGEWSTPRAPSDPSVEFERISGNCSKRRTLFRRGFRSLGMALASQEFSDHFIVVRPFLGGHFGAQLGQFLAGSRAIVDSAGICDLISRRSPASWDMQNDPTIWRQGTESGFLTSVSNVW